MVRITALMDNKTSDPERFASEHGLSFFVEYGDRTILFDCGKTAAFLDNAKALDMDLSRLDAVALSHGHYDHAGGYRHLIEAGLGSKALYVGKGFFTPKYARNGEELRDLTPDCGRDFMDTWGIHCHTVTDLREVFPGAFLISGFPRIRSYEAVPSRFVHILDGCMVQDEFHDEICLALQTARGIALVVGCSHPGIVNMVHHVSGLLHQPVWAVFGGTHLMEASPHRIEATLTELKQLGLQVLGLSHCSGEAAVGAIAAMDDIQSHYLAAGDSIMLV